VYKYLKYLIVAIALPSTPALADGHSCAWSFDDGSVVDADCWGPTGITVVANGDETRLEATGQPVAIVGRDEIVQVQGSDIARVLERLPGVVLTRNGGAGAFTALNLRGADADQLLVLVDGVPVADGASPAGTFDFGTLLPAGIGKIELLRGANGTIWGSRAMAGVLAVDTTGFDGASASLEYGGPRTWYAQGSAGRSGEQLDYGIDGAFLDSRGISAAAGGSEPDGVREWQVGGHGRIVLADGLGLRAGLRHFDGRLDLDGYPPPDYLFADTAEWQRTRRTSGYAGLDYSGDRMRLRGTWSLSDTRRANYDPAAGSAPTYTTQGRDQRFELRGRWDIIGRFRLHFGGERAWSRFATLFDAARSTTSSGAYAQLGFRADRVLLDGGLRYDDQDGFGGHWSLGADGALQLGNGWRLRASYGEGFKAPSLFQRFSDYGNIMLRPELSRSFDVGFELGNRNARTHFALSLFRRKSRDLIDFVSCSGITDGICANRPYGTYDNVGQARAQGIELEAAADVTRSLRLQGAFSYVEAVNRTPGAANEGNDLARRPRNALTLSVDWETPLAGLALGADLRAVSGGYDDPANLVHLAPYALGTVRASLPLTGSVELYGRIENIWNERYQTVAGYGTPGRSAYLGARARW
jgi:vitamin B12 transporter